MKLLPEVMDAIIAANEGLGVSERGVVVKVLLADCQSCNRRLVPLVHDCRPEVRRAA